MATPKKKRRPAKGRHSKRARSKCAAKRNATKCKPNDTSKAIGEWLMAADLKRSGLTKADGAQRGFKLLTPAQTRAKTKTSKYRGSYVWSYLIPYYDINGKLIKGYWRIRYLEPVLGPFGSRPKKPWRYSGPEGGRLRLYFDPTIDWTPIRRSK